MQRKGYEEWKKQLLTTAKEKKFPISAQFELTGRCNLDCKMCYVHNLDAAICKARELSTEEWKRVFDEALEQELLFATLTGGECLLRTDFKELYLHLWKKDALIALMNAMMNYGNAVNVAYPNL